MQIAEYLCNWGNFPFFLMTEIMSLLIMYIIMYCIQKLLVRLFALFYEAQISIMNNYFSKNNSNIKLVYRKLQINIFIYNAIIRNH